MHVLVFLSQVSPFSGIKWVTTPLTLCAFLAALGAWLIAKKFQRDEAAIKAAPESERVRLAESQLEFFHVSTEGLTKQQRYDLACVQIRARSQRFSSLFFAFIALALLAGAITAWSMFLKSEDGPVTTGIGLSEESQSGGKQVPREDVNRADGTRLIAHSLSDNAPSVVTASESMQLTETTGGRAFGEQLPNGNMAQELQPAFSQRVGKTSKLIANETRQNIEKTNQKSKALTKRYQDQSLVPTVLYSYEAEFVNGELHVSPNCEYLNRIRDGKEIPAMSHLAQELGTTFDSDADRIMGGPPLVLTHTTLNNSKNRVNLARQEIFVESSSPDYTPIPVFMSQVDRLFTFQLYNVGWGPMTNVKLTYGLKLNDSAKSKLGGRTFRHQFPQIKEAKFLEISKDLRSFGVKVNDLLAIQRGKKAPPKDWNFSKYLGPFKGEEAIVSGILEYDGLTSIGKIKRYKVPFKVGVPIVPPEGLGDQAVCSTRYDVLLRTKGAKYLASNRSIAKTLPPKGYDLMELGFKAPQSSVHRIVVRTFLLDGTLLSSEKVRLHIVIPRETGPNSVLASKQRRSTEEDFLNADW